jgi:phage baseplate assembly protein W
MESRFLGSGWAFPIVADTQGGIAPVDDAEKVRQSIWTILSTARGERIMRADFGCGIHDLVFESFGDAAIGQVLNEVSVALARWEPRIDVLGIDVSTDPDEPNLLLIAVDYSLRTTNSRFNLVYPFYVS